MRILRTLQKALPEFRVYIRDLEHIGRTIYIARYDSRKGQEFYTASLLPDKPTRTFVDQLTRDAKLNWRNRYSAGT